MCAILQARKAQEAGTVAYTEQEPARIRELALDPDVAWQRAQAIAARIQAKRAAWAAKESVRKRRGTMQA
jgi:hypothetical protein